MSKISNIVYEINDYIDECDMTLGEYWEHCDRDLSTMVFELWDVFKWDYEYDDLKQAVAILVNKNK